MLNNTGRIGIVFQHWSARVSKHQYRRDWALTVCGNTIFASSKHPVARYGPMTRVARVRRNTRCGVPLHSFGGHRCDRNTNPECFDARKLVAAGCPPKKCCRNTHFLQCTDDYDADLDDGRWRPDACVFDDIQRRHDNNGRRQTAVSSLAPRQRTAAASYLLSMVPPFLI